MTDNRSGASQTDGSAFFSDDGRPQPSPIDEVRYDNFINENSRRLGHLTVWIERLAREDLDQFNLCVHYVARLLEDGYQIAKERHSGD